MAGCERRQGADMDHSAVSAWRRLTGFVRKRDMGFLATTMSPRWFFMDFYVYPPLIVLCLILAFDDAGFGQAVLSAVLAAAGLVVWTLAEYVIHRFAFHHMPLVKDAHLEHHAEPEGLHGSPTLVSVLVFGLLAFLPLGWMFDLATAAALTAGLMMGYLAYVGVHYLIHHPALLGTGEAGSRARKALRALIRAHGVHHHQTGYNFGVTTLIWDRVFGTLHRR
jgi:sterol desaturase/sphingolipid hydroxylase (fatty acid hydroxylase superfamily)